MKGLFLLLPPLVLLFCSSPTSSEPIVWEEDDDRDTRTQDEDPISAASAGGENIPLDICVLPNGFEGTATLVEDCKTLDRYRAPPRVLNYQVRIFLFLFQCC